MRGRNDPSGSLDLTPELVARAFRPVPDPGPSTHYVEASEADLVALADRLLAGRPDGPLWVFAYGSLIWNPGFEVAARLPGTAHGWHRQFCLEMTSWRGSPEHPGLMLALVRGGQCRGLLLQVAEAEVSDVLRRLVLRELDSAEHFHTARWITVATAEGPLRALVFWAGPRGADISPSLPHDEVARRVARACGHVGSNAEYLYQTVAGLEALGLRDRNLWRLQALVARYLRRMPSPPAAS